MNFFEKIINGAESPISGVHPDFNIIEGNYWCFNRQFGLGDSIKMKVRVAFDDPTILDKCPFLAKIGPNEDSNISCKYIGFAYGDDESALTEWAKHFPFAELIKNLDHDGASNDKSKTIKIS